MSVVATVAVAIAILGLGFTALCAVVRIVRGPTILDRMIASDVLLTTLILSAGTDMVVRQQVDSIPLMIAVASTSVLATITVARYVKRRSQRAEAIPYEGESDHA